MARYFFNAIDGEFLADKEGSELSNDDAAKTEAVVVLAEWLKHRPELVWGGHHYGIEVTDAGGNVLFTTVTLALDRRAARESTAASSAG